MHYDSKNHDKKITTWLTEWSNRTGEPMPKRQKVIEKKKKWYVQNKTILIIRLIMQLLEGPAGPNAFHCDVCDLALTSLQHANQHYMGKRHRM